MEAIRVHQIVSKKGEVVMTGLPFEAVHVKVMKYINLENK
jgi:hypothetical protein